MNQGFGPFHGPGGNINNNNATSQKTTFTRKVTSDNTKKVKITKKRKVNGETVEGFEIIHNDKKSKTETWTIGGGK